MRVARSSCREIGLWPIISVEVKIGIVEFCEGESPLEKNQEKSPYQSLRTKVKLYSAVTD